jgi:hypothetical protein
VIALAFHFWLFIIRQRCPFLQNKKEAQENKQNILPGRGTHYYRIDFQQRGRFSAETPQ